MKARLIRALIPIAFVSFLVTAQACMWDSDTLEMERRKFPSALELVTGKFLRHSDEFYRWRIEDRLRRLKEEPDNLALYDDLAVAHDKVGEHSKAIETILQKDGIQPGLYETEANLGTFYIHDGQLEKGLEHIKQAIEINPNAHFGREVYQQLLVEYVLSKRVQEKLPLPMSTDARGYGEQVGFGGFVTKQRNTDPSNEVRELGKAVRGVLGMMRFGHHDSPVLLEALGDLLLANPNSDAKRLAARAYLKASYEVDDGTARQEYRLLAEAALSMQTVKKGSTTELMLPQLEATFRDELKEAETWYAAVRIDESQWIETGANVDEEFSKKYYAAPLIKVSDVSSKGRNSGLLASPRFAIEYWPQIVLSGFLLVTVAFALLFVAVRGRRNTKKV